MIRQVASLETLCVDSMRINDLQAMQYDGCKRKILNLLKEIIPSIHTDTPEDLVRWTFQSLNEEFRYIQRAYTRLQDSLPPHERAAINFNSILDYRNAQIALEYNNYAQIAQAVLREVQLPNLRGILNDGNLSKKEKIESIKAWFNNEENRNSIHRIRDLNIRDANLTRIPEEIQLFIGLRELLLNQNQITRIENLPAGLIRLFLDQNQISKIENLPAGLIRLNLRYNQQISKIENLPAGLEGLHLNQNQISKIENLPAGLSYLDLDHNQISKIENLPAGLENLDLYHNQIRKIENLPAGLIRLELSQNQISKIENLPYSLIWLHLDQNQIRERPHNLPANLVLSMENQNDPLKNRLRNIIVLSVFVVLLSYLIKRSWNNFRRD